MTTLVYAAGMVVFFLGVVASIALHEVGHMYPAKKFGVKVTQYFVGFGKTVWSTKRGETEYGVKAFPLGGFVKMIGMLPPEKRHPDGRVKGFSGGAIGKLIADARAVEYEHITAEDDDRLFYRQVWWKKVIVMAGGPMMNVFLAVVILGAVFMLLGVSKPTLAIANVSDCVQPATVASTVCKPGAPASPARAAGFHVGDRVVSVDGVAMSSWDQFSRVIRKSEGTEINVVVVAHLTELLGTRREHPDDLDVAAERDRLHAVLGLAEPLAPHRGAEADEVLRDLPAEGLGRDHVPELVEPDRDQDRADEDDDAQ
jgi:membrane-associated protease RseP (regulator of RpoE activity)